MRLCVCVQMAGVKKQLREAERRLAEALADGEAMRREVEARAAETGEDGKLMEVRRKGWQRTRSHCSV